MVRYQYAGTPANPPAPTLNSSNSGNVTSAKAGTYYVWLQYQNRAGFSGVSTVASAAVATGKRLDITIPGSALPSPVTVGAVTIYPTDIQQYLVLINTVNNPATAAIAAAFPGYEADGITPKTLPTTISLSRDSHFDLGGSVANEAALPSNPVNGMRRSIDSLSGQIYAYNSTTSNWQVVKPQLFSSYVADLTGIYGANRDLDNLDEDDVSYPDYAVDGSDSQPVRFWLVNDQDSAITQGRQIACAISAAIQGVDVDLSSSVAIAGALSLTFLGYVNTTSGALDTTGPGGTGTAAGIGEAVPYTGPETALSLPKDLPAGSAYLLEVKLNVTAELLNRRIPQGAVLKFSPAFFASPATQNAAALVTGSLITGDYDGRRIVPVSGLSVRALNGSGLIKIASGAGYSFNNVGQQTVVNLLADSADQNVAINIQGDCIVLDEIGDTTALRCIVGTEDGVGSPSAYSNAIALSNLVYLDVTVNYPSTIRTDYPDIIAGSNKGQFNASFVRIYLKPTSGNVLYWEFPVTLNATSDTFRVGAIAGTDLGGTTLPEPLSERFGPYGPTSFSTATSSGSSVFSSTNYQVAIAFVYSNTATSFDHRTTSGCIPEISGSLADVFVLLNYVGAPVGTTGNLRTVAESSRSENKEIFVDQAGNPYRWKPTEATSTDIDYEFDSGTTSGPSSGLLRFNNAAVASTTQIFVNESDADGISTTSILDLIQTGTQLQIDIQGSPASYAIFQVSGSVTDGGSHRTIPVTYLEHSGSFADGDAIALSVDTSVVRPFDLLRSESGRWVVDDSNQILAVSGAPANSAGEAGDLAISTDDAQLQYGDIYRKVGNSWGSPVLNALPYTRTSGSFVQPTVGNTVIVSVRNARIFPVGGSVIINNTSNVLQGSYKVTAKPSSTSLTLENLGADGSAISGSTIATNAFVLPAGSQGATGAAGTPAGIRYTFNSATSGPAASGQIRLNNATLASVTQIFVHESDRNGVGVSGLLSQISNGSLLTLFDESDTTSYAYYTLNSQTDNGSDRTLSVTHIASVGALSDAVTLAFVIRGSDGTAATISVGTVTTGSAGSSASVTNAGTSSAAVLNFSIPSGADGVSGFGVRYTFSTSTSSGPSSGQLRLNNASPASATQIYVHESDRNGASVATVLAAISNGSPIQILDDNDSTAYAYYTLNSQTDNGSDRTFSVTYTGGNGTLSGNVSLSFSARGEAGITGATGSVSAASGLILEHVSSPPTTGDGETAVYVLEAEPSKVYKREENNGTISELGSGTGGGGNGSESVAFSTSVKFDKFPTIYARHQLAGATTFTLNTSGALPGGCAVVSLIGDGSTIPNLSAFDELTGSSGFDARNGIVNLLYFLYDGTSYWYTVQQKRGAVPIDSDAQAVIAAFTGTYDEAREDLVNALVAGLKADGLWAKIDVLAIAGQTQNDTLLNWKNPGTFNGTAVGGVTFTADRGFQGNGTNGYINTGFNPNTAGGAYTQNSGTLAVWSRTATNDTVIGWVDIGSLNGGLQMLLHIRLNNQFFARLNSNTGGPAASAAGLGLFHGTRTGASATAHYINGASVLTGSDSAVALSNFNFPIYVGAVNFGGTNPDLFSPRQYSCYVIGGGMSASESANLYARLNTYLTAIGAN